MSIYDKASLVHIPSGVKSGTLYNVLPNNADGDFDFTRGSTATRVNKDGLIEDVAIGVPRLNYPLLDGVVQDCPALLLEPSRQNLTSYSEQFDNIYWTKSLTNVTANQAISPDGSQTADTITKTGDYGSVAKAGITISSGFNYTLSIFVKKSTTDFFSLRQASGGYDVRKQFNLTTKEVSNGLAANQTGFVSSKIEEYPNDWYRLSIVCTSNGTSLNINFYSGKVGESTFNGDSYTWGAQVEAGSYPTSYIPTSGSAVTRSADVCNGAEATFNDSEGVLFLETSMLSSNPDNSTFQIDDGTSTNRVRIRFTTTTNQINGLLYSGVAGQPNINYTANDVTNPNKVAIRYQVGQIDLFFNGFEVATITGNATPTGFDNLSLGTEGVLKQAMTFNEALSDTELENLTSWDSFNEMATEQLYTIE